jgi:hypothetical protein
MPPWGVVSAGSGLQLSHLRHQPRIRPVILNRYAALLHHPMLPVLARIWFGAENRIPFTDADLRFLKMGQCADKLPTVGSNHPHRAMKTRQHERKARR